MKNRLRSYWALTKPRLTGMVIFTVWLGYALAPAGKKSGSLFFHTVFGSWLLAAAGAVLNQYMERDVDSLMNRTRERPLPQHQVNDMEAAMLGVVLTVVGAFELLFFSNALVALLGLITLVTYLFAYTPMKRTTPFCTLVGAIPGAIPPMMGWSAVTEGLQAQAWVLFAILFLWQLPHFLAIAWMYREDYARAGMPMLPVVDPDGRITAHMIVLYTAVLIPVTLIPAHLGITTVSYSIGAVMLGAAFFACGVWAAMNRTVLSARRLLLASVIYLPSLLTWMACARPA